MCESVCEGECMPIDSHLELRLAVEAMASLHIPREGVCGPWVAKGGGLLIHLVGGIVVLATHTLR